VTNINPNSTTLVKVASGGKGSDTVRRMTVHLRTVDAPGRTCDVGESSGPVKINLKMVDDTGDILLDNAKTVVCDGGPQRLVRNVPFRSPKNCEGGVVPSGRSVGVITASASAPGTGTYTEDQAINCNE
jgi:hypothetical protein